MVKSMLRQPNFSFLLPVKNKYVHGVIPLNECTTWKFGSFTFQVFNLVRFCFNGTTTNSCFWTQSFVHLGIGNEFLTKIIGAKARKVPSIELVLRKETECSKNVPWSNIVNTWDSNRWECFFQRCFHHNIFVRQVSENFRRSRDWQVSREQKWIRPQCGFSDMKGWGFITTVGDFGLGHFNFTTVQKWLKWLQNEAMSGWNQKEKEDLGQHFPIEIDLLKT